MIGTGNENQIRNQAKKQLTLLTATVNAPRIRDGFQELQMQTPFDGSYYFYYRYYYFSTGLPGVRLNT